MKFSTGLFSMVALVLMSAPVMAAEVAIPNTFSAGTPAVADEVNANFTALETAVNSVGSRLGNLEGDVKQRLDDVETSVDSNEARIAVLEHGDEGRFLNSSLNFRVGRPEAYVADAALVSVLLSNVTSTTCDVSTYASQEGWKIGANTKVMEDSDSLKFSEITLPGVVGEDPSSKKVSESVMGSIVRVPLTTYTLVERKIKLEFFQYDYTIISLARNETSSLDTCGVDDVLVQGAIVTFPGGLREYVSPGQMSIK